MPPELPNELPALIGLLTKNVPSYYKPAVASAVFPALAAHLHGVKFRYWDNRHGPRSENRIYRILHLQKRSVKEIQS